MIAEKHWLLYRQVPFDEALDKIKPQYFGKEDEAETASEIETLLPTLNQVKSVVEVGAGYGRTAHAILSKFPEMQYAVIDILPAALIAETWLKQQGHTNVKFFHPLEKGWPKPNLTICISVLSELDPGEIKQYINLASRGKYLYIKDWKPRMWKDNRHNPVNEETYQIPKSWTLLLKKDALMDKRFFEALYSIV